MLHTPEQIRQEFDNFASYAYNEFTLYSSDAKTRAFVRFVKRAADYYHNNTGPHFKLFNLTELVTLSSEWRLMTFTTDVISRGHIERFESWGKQINHIITHELECGGAHVNDKKLMEVFGVDSYNCGS